MTTEIKKVKPQKQETARAWWIGSSLKEYTDAVQELSDRLKKESEQGKEMTEEDDDIQEYKKPWVGLTDEEILKFQDIVPNTLGYDLIQFAKAVEAKLKEKNT